MGELLGVPEWVAVTLCVLLGLAIWLIGGLIVHARMIRRTAAKRASPSRDEFLTAMVADGVSPDAAEFLWKTALFYVEPRLTPHPDDLLGKDLYIHDHDWSMDWPRDYAEQRGFHESNFPDWPEGWPPTLRNYGRWLSMAPA